MIFILAKLFKVVENSGWKISLGILLVLFVAGWLLMGVFEPAESEIPSLRVYWWWFLVTTTTVGYGDYFPLSSGGRVIATVIMVSGIGAIGIVITQFATLGASIGRRVMEGRVKLSEKDHIVILGYHAGRTEFLIREMLADKAWAARKIVLCFKPDQAQENPIPDLTKAVKGKLTSDDVLGRACVETAARIVADGDDDNETLIIALSAYQKNQTAHIVAAVQDKEETQEHIDKIHRGIECVPQNIVTMIVQAVQDPGITRLYSKLLSNVEGQAGFRIDLPENVGPWIFGDLLVAFKKHLDATLMAATETHEYESPIIENPAWGFEVKGGMSLYYVAPERLTNVDFTALAP